MLSGAYFRTQAVNTCKRERVCSNAIACSKFAAADTYTFGQFDSGDTPVCLHTILPYLTYTFIDLSYVDRGGPACIHAGFQEEEGPHRSVHTAGSPKQQPTVLSDLQSH